MSTIAEDYAKEAHVASLRALANEWELEGREILDAFTTQGLAGIYNGLGSDGMPAWLRSAATYLSPDLEPVALIHDVEWHLSDGSREGFTASNERFRRNGCRAAKARFGWADPRRYLLMHRARRFANYCRLFGWSAWKSV
ncbi:MAG: hypothetical protein IJ678_06090 [Kiritimatiellae bacterium]|nr:hypothetical protein [Kiritimatiellia bacterium]